jgi:hypothetical protein
MKGRAWIGLKDTPNYRRDSFSAGLKRAGYQVELETTLRPGNNDILVIWNRFGAAEGAAIAFEAAGRPVLVAENGYLGKEFCGEPWYALSRNLHNGAGTWEYEGPQRWDALGIELPPFRTSGKEMVLLPQRSIGSNGVAMPRGWTEEAQARVKARVRPHPGIRPAIPLEVDLGSAHSVYTWGSGAALKAIAMGIPAYYDMPAWIGAPAAAKLGDNPNRNEVARLDMFRRLVWAMWRLREIESGEAFEVLL